MIATARLDLYRAEAERYLAAVPDIDLDANLEAARQNQLAYAASVFAYSQQGFIAPNQPMSCSADPGICDCCILYRHDC